MYNPVRCSDSRHMILVALDDAKNLSLVQFATKTPHFPLMTKLTTIIVSALMSFWIGSFILSLFIDSSKK
jgi:hypothetical protein